MSTLRTTMVLSAAAAAILAAAASGLTAAAAAPQQPPATEVYLATLSKTDGRIRVGTPENISNSPGYDNQPFFTPERHGAAVLFTSARGTVESSCGKPQTDIYRYDITARTLTQLTNTAECEYSPTVTPGGQISMIRVEADGTQRLWQFSGDRAATLVLTEIKPVGYHAWLDGTTLALFVLGQPPTLQIADTGTGKAVIAARDIGQSLLRMPKGGVSFVQQAGEGEKRSLSVHQIVMEAGKPVTKLVTPAVPGARQAHLAWGPDGTLFMAHAGSLHTWRAGAAGWLAIADLDALGLRNVTRLAVSEAGNRIAIVAQPQ